MIFRLVENKGQMLFAPRQEKGGALSNFRHRAKWLGGQKSRRLSLVFNSLDDFFRNLFASQDVLVGNGQRGIGFPPFRQLVHHVHQFPFVQTRKLAHYLIQHGHVGGRKQIGSRLLFDMDKENGWQRTGNELMPKLGPLVLFLLRNAVENLCQD